MPDINQFKDQCRDIVNNMSKMIVAARSAFNRHSTSHVSDLKNLQTLVGQQLAALLKQVETAAAAAAGDDKINLLRLHSVLSRVQIIAENLAGLTDPLQKKIGSAVLFSEKAVGQTNYLFDLEMGLLRSVLDTILTENDFLKKYLAGEGRKIVQAANDFATEHEDRLIEGLCQPQAAPIFLAILDRFRTMAQQEIELAEFMGK